MAITKGAKVVSDESAGLQNGALVGGAAGDLDDNDILVSSLPTAFAGFGTAINAALSGYTGAADNTGSDAFTVTPSGAGAITGVSFVGPDGNPLDGLDSGLMTVDGTKIFLYTGSDNNVVLGRVGNNNSTPGNPADDTANASGTIAFAGYIQESTSAGGAITGGKIWIAQYQTLKHPDPTKADEPVDLTGKVFIGVSQDANFSLAGAPSGQQLFLMFTTEGATADAGGRIPGVSIIVTGRDPLNQSDSGAAITSADTVNSSQGGGNTTLGTNNQAVTEQEGLRFTFVSGAKADVTIPNLSPGEAGIESNIDFTAFFGARSATFQIVQETGGTSAMVKLTASLTGGSGGVNFIDSYVNDLTTEKVAITAGSVTVKTFAGATVTTAVITYNADGTVLITGVPNDSQIMYRTSTDHNRVLIENAGSLSAKNGDKTHADFDIGGFRVLQTSVDKMEIGSNMVFEDDGPNIALLEQSGTGDATVDESSLGTPGATDDFEGSSFFNQSSSGFGSDGSGASISQVYALSLVNPLSNSGIVDTATGSTVTLKITGTTLITGYVTVGGADQTVFTITLDSATGKVTLTQERAIVHANTASFNEAEKFDGSQILLSRTDTITDKDGDSATSTETADITQQFVFLDDGPSISTTGTEPTLTVDETVLTTDATASFAGNFTSAFGADGAGTLGYALGINAGVTGLVDSATGQAVVLSVVSGQVQGRTATSNDLVFTVSVNATTGAVTLDQQRAVVHADATNPDDSRTLNADNLVTLIGTKTDKDGDSAQATLNIGQNLVFKDDGPSLAFGNLVGTGTSLPQFGTWSGAYGADGASTAGLDIAKAGWQLGGVSQSLSNFVFNETSPGSPDANGNFQFTGSLTGDFDNNGSVDANPLTFTLSANPTTGTYTLDLAAPVTSVTITDTANGALGAGGPDAVQTLFIPPAPAIPKETVVFFSAVTSATAANIASLIGAESGSTPNDPTEANLETPPMSPFIDVARAMNVSTSGIGVANNVLEGDTDAAIGGTDESFVINPLSQVNTVRIFVDNSVSGYKFTPGPGSGGNERLYYTAYFTDGTNSGLTLVATDLNTSAGTARFFDVNGGTKLIDAVQLTMAKGDVKIPNIQFITQTESLANDISLDFTATLTDKDGDTATSSFSADLFTNEAASSTFDYELVGTALAKDSFNVDLASTRNDYKITGFDMTAGARDQIVLLGDAAATVTNINNAGADSIVTITESGAGQITTLTVVGVDLQAGDIVFGSP